MPLRGERTLARPREEKEIKRPIRQDAVGASEKLRFDLDYQDHPDIITYTMDRLVESGRHGRKASISLCRELGKTAPESMRWLGKWVWGSHDEAVEDAKWVQTAEQMSQESGAVGMWAIQSGEQRRKIWASDEGMFFRQQTNFSRVVSLQAKSKFQGTTNDSKGVMIATGLNGLLDEDRATLRYPYITAIGAEAAGIFGTTTFEFGIDFHRRMHGIRNGAFIYRMRDPLSTLVNVNAMSMGTLRWMIFVDIVPKSEVAWRHGLSRNDAINDLPEASSEDYNRYTLLGYEKQDEDSIPMTAQYRVYYRAGNGDIWFWKVCGPYCFEKLKDPLMIGMIPGMKLDAHKVPNFKWWAPGDVEKQAEMQAQLDYAQTLHLQHMLIYSLAPLFVREGALLGKGFKGDSGDIFAVLGKWFRVDKDYNPAEVVHFPTPPPLPPAVPFSTYYQGKLEQQTAPNITTGQSRSGDSGRKVIALAQQYDQSLEGRMFALAEMDRRMAGLWIRMMVQHGDPVARRPCLAHQQSKPQGAIAELMAFLGRKGNDFPQGTWGEMLRMMGLKPNTEEAREWARRIPIEVSQVPISESTRMRELNELISFMAVESGASADPYRQYLIKTLVDLSNSATLRANWNEQQAAQNPINRLLEMIGELAARAGIDPEQAKAAAIGGQGIPLAISPPNTAQMQGGV